MRVRMTRGVVHISAGHSRLSPRPPHVSSAIIATASRVSVDAHTERGLPASRTSRAVRTFHENVLWTRSHAVRRSFKRPAINSSASQASLHSPILDVQQTVCFGRAHSNPPRPRKDQCHTAERVDRQRGITSSHTIAYQFPLMESNRTRQLRLRKPNPREVLVTSPARSNRRKQASHCRARPSTVVPSRRAWLIPVCNITAVQAADQVVRRESRPLPFRLVPRNITDDMFHVKHAAAPSAKRPVGHG